MENIEVVVSFLTACKMREIYSFFEEFLDRQGENIFRIYTSDIPWVTHPKLSVIYTCSKEETCQI
jgi:hypothetical protein